MVPLQNHSMIWVGKDLKITIPGQGRLPLDQGPQSPIQAGLKYFQEWGIQNFSGQAVQCLSKVHKGHKEKIQQKPPWSLYSLHLPCILNSLSTRYFLAKLLRASSFGLQHLSQNDFKSSLNHLRLWKTKYLWYILMGITLHYLQGAIRKKALLVISSPPIINLLKYKYLSSWWWLSLAKNLAIFSAVKTHHCIFQRVLYVPVIDSWDHSTDCQLH